MRLSVHLDTLARLRAQSPDKTPDLLNGAVALDLAGADGIVARLEERGGAVTIPDLTLLRQAVRTTLALEIEPSESLVHTAMELRPSLVTFVPPRGDEGGLDVAANAARLKEAIKSLRAVDVQVSVRILPVIAQAKEARRLHTDFVTLDSRGYATARTPDATLSHFEEIEATALGAEKLGLRVIASGGLDHTNIGPVAGLGTVEEAVLGHRLFARALFTGMDRAFTELRDAVRWHGARG